MLELQADCFAGVWANHTERMQQSNMKDFLENGDVDEALRAASMIGDDRLQMQSQGYVVPESFTHGTAEQRSRRRHARFRRERARPACVYRRGSLVAPLPLR